MQKWLLKGEQIKLILNYLKKIEYFNLFGEWQISLKLYLRVQKIVDCEFELQQYDKKKCIENLPQAMKIIVPPTFCRTFLAIQQRHQLY